jgi:hypothetical protein
VNIRGKSPKCFALDLSHDGRAKCFNFLNQDLKVRIPSVGIIHPSGLPAGSSTVSLFWKEEELEACMPPWDGR